VGGAEIFVGRAGELGTPIIDVRDWFILSALRNGSRLLGVVYADAHQRRAPLDETAALLQTTASIAAVALANVMLYEQTRQQAMCDPLTGLLNRRALNERLEQEIERCNRQNVNLTCVMLDIDDFKAVNDLYGHPQGDVVLQRVAATLRSVSRSQDVLCRYAGDEFVVIFVDSAATSSAVLVGRLSAELRAAGLRCSLGAARYPEDAVDASTLLAVSDRALYRAKASGKDRFAFA
jgi:diguanylate cyclase (GGDEF)-like protein